MSLGYGLVTTDTVAGPINNAILAAIGLAVVVSLVLWVLPEVLTDRIFGRNQAHTENVMFTPIN